MKLPLSPRVIRYESTDSTNERALAAIAEGSAQHGDLHLAEFQTAGRGRLGRTWHSGEGESLLFSLVLLPEGTPPVPTHLTVATCLALHDVALEQGLDEARLKWPNDLLVGDAKLCGTLLETRGLDSESPHCVVGVGMNLTQREFPSEVTDERPATSLRLEGVRVSRERVLELIWERLTARLSEAPETLFRDYTAALSLDGQVVLGTGTEELRGELVEVHPGRGIRVRDTSGQVRGVALEFVRELRAAD